MRLNLKKLLSVLLTLAMVISMMPTAAFATEETTYDVANMSNEEVVELCIQLAADDDYAAVAVVGSNKVITLEKRLVRHAA